MAAFPLEVVTPEEGLFAGPALALVLRTDEGDMTVLDGHTSLVASVVPSDVRIDHEDGTSVHLAVHGGFLEVDTSPGAAEKAPAAEWAAGGGAPPVKGLSTRVTLLAGVAELADRIDVARARRAKEEAEARLAELGGPAALDRATAGEGTAAEERTHEAAELAAASARAELRLKVAGETD